MTREERPGAAAPHEAPPGLGALPDFVLERFFDRFEFDLPYQLGSSDPETLALAELLALADDDARARWDALRLGYRTAAGDPALRAAIASLYPGRSPDDVVVTVGAAEALMLAFAATIRPGDGVVALTPAYQSLHEMPRAVGGELRLVDVEQIGADAPRWRFPLDRLMDALDADARVLVLNVPHNPTGVAISPADLRAIAARCVERGIRLIGDEVYRGLEWQGPTPPPVASISGDAVSIGVTSKVYGLAGLRIGWLVTGDRSLRDRAIAIKDYTTLCAPGPSEVLATIALRSHDRLVERTRGRCIANMAVLEAFVEASPQHFAWARPHATTISVARVGGSVLARDGSPDGVLARWRAAGVLVVPGPAFGCDPGTFRLGFGRADLPEALAALAGAG